MKLKRIKVAIDSPATSGAGTISKMLSKKYNLLYCDTGKIYRFFAYKLIDRNIKNKIKYLSQVSKKMSLKNLQNKNLLNDKIALKASQIAKDLKIRKLATKFQKHMAYNPPLKYAGSVLDGRDICSVVVPDADIKFYITAEVKIRAKRRFKEYIKSGKKVKLAKILESMKKRDKEDRTRTHSKLKKTKDSYLINTTNLSIKSSFLKVNKIMDSKLNKLWKK